MEQPYQNTEEKKSFDKKWLKYLIYFIVALVIIFLGIKLIGHKNIQQNNQGNAMQDLLGGNSGGTPPDDAGGPPPDEGNPPSQQGQNPGTPPQN